MGRSARIIIAVLVFLSASAFLLNESYAEAVRNRTQIRDFMAISTMAPVGFVYLLIAGVIVILVDLVLGVVAGVLAYAVTWFFTESPANAYWVVRENPIGSAEWLEVVKKLPDATVRYGVCLEEVPVDLPEPHHPQPGVRFFPANSESLSLARKAAKALDGYVQVR